MENAHAGAKGVLLFYRWPVTTPYAHAPDVVQHILQRSVYTQVPGIIVQRPPRGYLLPDSPEEGTAFLVINLTELFWFL